MKGLYEYIAEVSREKQERLTEMWMGKETRCYRWEDVVEEALATARK